MYKISSKDYTFLGLLTIINVLNFVDRSLLASFANFIVPDLGLTDTEFGTLVGLAFLFFYSIMGLFMGVLADTMNRPRLIAFGVALWSLFTIASGAARGFITMAIPRMFIGVGESILTPSAISSLSDRFPESKMGFAIGFYYMGIPIGAGLAYSIKLAKKKNLVCIYIGDAAIEEGTFFESINFCVLKKLPVIFICENNFFSVYTHIKNRQPSNRKIYKLAKAIGAISNKFTQDNPFTLYQKFEKLFNKIRNKPMTHFVEIETCRYLEHCGPNDDIALGYRNTKELKKWKRKDPLIFSRNYLIKKRFYNKEKMKILDNKIINNVNKDYLYLIGLKKPKFKDIRKFTYKS